MNPIADMVERMLANDDAPAAIVAAVRAMEGVTTVTSRVTLASRDASRPEPLTPAQRAKRYRGNIKLKQGEAKANDVASTVTKRHVTRHETSRDAVTDHCDLSSLSESSLVASKKDIQTSVVEGRKRGARLAADALLSDDDRAFAVKHGLEPDQVWAEFKDYWIGVPGQRGLKLNWPATWRNRVRELAGRRKSSNGKPTVHDAAKELTRHIEELNERPSGLRQQAGPGAIRLLPSG